MFALIAWRSIYSMKTSGCYDHGSSRYDCTPG